MEVEYEVLRAKRARLVGERLHHMRGNWYLAHQTYPKRSRRYEGPFEFEGLALYLAQSFSTHLERDVRLAFGTDTGLNQEQRTLLQRLAINHNDLVRILSEYYLNCKFSILIEL